MNKCFIEKENGDLIFYDDIIISDIEINLSLLDRIKILFCKKFIIQTQTFTTGPIEIKDIEINTIIK